MKKTINLLAVALLAFASTFSVSALISWNFREELPQLTTNTFISNILLGFMYIYFFYVTT